MDELGASLLLALWASTQISLEPHYLRYVTLSQFFRWVGKTLLNLSIVLTTVLVGAHFFPATNNPTTSSSVNFVPKYVWFGLLLMCLTYLLRGAKLEMPRFRIKRWLWVNTALFSAAAILFACNTYLSETETFCVGIVLFFVGGLYEILVEAGKANYSSAPHEFDALVSR